MATIHPLPPIHIERAVQVLACEACGTEVNAGCTCGKRYIPKTSEKRALIKAALLENHERSNRTIAKELGVDDTTVAAVRAELEANAGIPHWEAPTGPKRGSAPSAGSTGRVSVGSITTSTTEPSVRVKEINKFHEEIVTNTNDYTGRLDNWLDDNPDLDDEGKGVLMQALALAITSLEELVKKLQK